MVSLVRLLEIAGFRLQGNSNPVELSKSQAHRAPPQLNKKIMIRRDRPRSNATNTETFVEQRTQNSPLDFDPLAQHLS